MFWMYVFVTCFVSFFLGKLFKIHIDRQIVIRTTTYLKRCGCGDFPNCERRKTFVLDNSHVDQYNSHTRRDQIQWHLRRIYIVPRIDDVTTTIAMKKFVPEFGPRAAIVVEHVAFYRHRTWCVWLAISNDETVKSSHRMTSSTVTMYYNRRAKDDII